MSRSYKHHPVYTAGKSSFNKRYANRRFRRIPDIHAETLLSGKSNLYRKAFEPWDICDFRTYSNPSTRKESLFDLSDLPDLWQKCYRRK